MNYFKTHYFSNKISKISKSAESSPTQLP